MPTNCKALESRRRCRGCGSGSKKIFPLDPDPYCFPPRIRTYSVLISWFENGSGFQVMVCSESLSGAWIMIPFWYAEIQTSIWIPFILSSSLQIPACHSLGSDSDPCQSLGSDPDPCHSLGSDPNPCQSYGSDPDPCHSLVRIQIPVRV